MTPPRILVPPGIGDAYWVMVKLRGFLKQHGIMEPPDVWVQDSGPRRTVEFLASVPFITAVGYHSIQPTQEYAHITHEAYRTNGRTQFRNVAGMDWFLSYNGVLGAGQSLADVDPEYPCEWYLPLQISDQSLNYRRQMQSGGPYAAVYLPDGGFYRMWWAHFGPQRIVDAMQIVSARLGVRIVFFGAEWDKHGMGWAVAESQASANWCNNIGQTDYQQLVGLLLGASVVFGMPSGSTILPMVWKIPTALMWHKYFTRAFWTNVVPPDSPYRALDVLDLDVEGVVAAVCSLAEGNHARGPDRPAAVQG